MSATPCPPAAWRCSTFGEGGLNCRVRNGIGSIPASVVALMQGALARTPEARHPQGRMATEAKDPSVPGPALPRWEDGCKGSSY